jgi:hypothetical protein
MARLGPRQLQLLVLLPQLLPRCIGRRAARSILLLRIHQVCWELPSHVSQRITRRWPLLLLHTISLLLLLLLLLLHFGKHILLLRCVYGCTCECVSKVAGLVWASVSCCCPAPQPGPVCCCS